VAACQVRSHGLNDERVEHVKVHKVFFYYWLYRLEAITGTVLKRKLDAGPLRPKVTSGFPESGLEIFFCQVHLLERQV